MTDRSYKYASFAFFMMAAGVFAFAVAQANVPDGEYRLRGGRRIPNGGVASCNAGKRLLGDKYVVRVKEDGVTVNNLTWRVTETDHPGYLWLMKGHPGDQVWYEMWVTVVGTEKVAGGLTLHGHLEANAEGDRGAECKDTITLVRQ